MSGTLAAICDHARARVAEGRRQRPLRDLLADAAIETPPRGFARALARTVEGDGLALIAEIKRASPSAGRIRAEFDAAAIALAYEAGGAACLSVLTEPRWFEGQRDHLMAARAACALPVLRKDFIVDAWQVAEARAMGADCVLLILAALSDAQAAELEAAATELGMDVLAEAHDAAEVKRACRLQTPLIGINNRDLNTLVTDPDTGLRLRMLVPPDRMVVAESGLRSHADLLRHDAEGVRAFLVGESLMRQPDIEAATRALLGRG